MNNKKINASVMLASTILLTVGSSPMIENNNIGSFIYTSNAAEDTRYVIANSGLNMRKGAGQNYEKICTLSLNTKVNVLEKKNNSDTVWCRVKILDGSYKGKDGWVVERYINPVEAGTSVAMYVDTNPGSPLNFRTGASTSYSIIGKLYRGDSVSVLGTSGTWSKIRVNDGNLKGKEGWVSSNYLTTSKIEKVTSDTSTLLYVCTGNGSGRLNVRPTAGTSKPPVDSEGLKHGSGIYVRNSGVSGWYKVSYKGVDRYASSKYFYPERCNHDEKGNVIKTQTTSTSTTPVWRYVCTGPGGGRLNVRKGPGTSYAKINGNGEGLKHGAKIETIGKRVDSWYKVTYNGQTGYASSSHFKNEKCTCNEKTETVTIGEQKYKPYKENGRVRITNGSGYAAAAPGGKASSSQMSVRSGYVYNYTERCRIGNKDWYKITALASSATGWVSGCSNVNEGTVLGKSQTTVRTRKQEGVFLYKSPKFVSKERKRFVPADAQLTVVDPPKGNYMKVKYKPKLGFSSTGFINLGMLQFTNKSGFARNTGLVKTPKEEIESKLMSIALDQNVSGQSSDGMVDTRTGTITNGDTYLRATANWSGEKLVLLKVGETVEVISSDSKWTKIKYSEETGYVSNDYIKEDVEIVNGYVKEDVEIVKVKPISEPFIATFGMDGDEDEMLLQQYIVEVTMNGDETKKEYLRFASDDISIIENISVGKEMTVILDKQEVETEGQLPKYILGVQNDGKEDNKEAKVRALTKIAKDYVRLAIDSGEEIEDFSEEEIRSIVELIK